jgi:hypothetical protein
MARAMQEPHCQINIFLVYFSMYPDDFRSARSRLGFTNMVMRAQMADRASPRWEHQDSFEYQSPPRAGLNWAFARKLMLDVLVGASMLAAAIFWGCLFLAAFH